MAKIKTATGKMQLKDLRKTHPNYADMIAEWNLCISSYDGIRSLIEIGAINRHERESLDNYTRRLSELFSFGYSRSVVDLFNFYLFKKPFTVTVPEKLASNISWYRFIDDCNLFGDSLDSYLADQGRYASIYGHIGFLVDKPTATAENIEQEIARGIYPYISAYHPPAILDWQYAADDTGRPQLVYLKLRDDDGNYRLWWRDLFQVWAEKEDDDGGGKRTSDSKDDAVLLAEGPNPLGVIPFVFLINTKSRAYPIGISDISEIARIDLSIVRDFSQIGEITNYAAFPMMRKPFVEVSVGSQGTVNTDQQDDAGPGAILEFDPQHPESKPDWLAAEVAEPVNAILATVTRKVAEIYRAANSGGLTATEGSTDAKSGVALTAEFQLLNAKLVRKAAEIERCMREIVRHWLRWIGMAELFDEVVVEAPRSYDVPNLAQDLANALTAKTVVRSQIFRQEVEKGVARQVLPNADDETMAEIDAEIEAEPKPTGAELFLGKAARPIGAVKEEEKENEEEQ